MNKIHIDFCKTVFRKDDFKAPSDNPKLTWESECRRLKLPKNAKEFTANVTYAWVEDIDYDAFTNKHAHDVIEYLCGGTNSNVVKHQPELGGDVTLWFSLELSLKRHRCGLAEYSDVSYKRFDGCPSVVSESAMEVRAVIKGLLKKSRRQYIAEKGVVTPTAKGKSTK